MGKIVVTEFMSLDGVMEEPRWTFDFDRGKEGDQFKYEELFDAESLLLGRTTYQGFAAAWPNMGGDDFGQRMNNIHKYVVSTTLADSEATWGPTTVLRGDVAAEVQALKDQPGVGVDLVVDLFRGQLPARRRQILIVHAHHSDQQLLPPSKRWEPSARQIQ